MRLAWSGLTCLALVLAAAGCPPGAAQIKAARDAHYRGPPEALFQGAEAAAIAKYYKLGETDSAQEAFMTQPKVWGPNGENLTTGAGDAFEVHDNSIVIEYEVRVVAAGHDRYAISIEPHIRRLRAGRPNLDDLKPDDPSLPGWVQGKTDDLTVAIHDNLAAYAVPAPPR